jgi:hypothetical protein
MAEIPPTTFFIFFFSSSPSSSGANSRILPTQEDKDFWKASPKEALRTAVELYNKGLEAEVQLNWENIKKMFDNTEPHFWDCKEKKARYRRRRLDVWRVEEGLFMLQEYKCPAQDAAQFLLKDLDYKGIIRCQYREKWGLRDNFRENSMRAKYLPPWS